MSSSDKTEFLGLNSWLGSDKPQRADFNFDNYIIDNAMNNHSKDMNVHISNQERGKWNSPYFFGVYYGDGTTKRTVDLNCPFIPSFGIVFAGNCPVALTDFTAKANYNYFALISKRSSTIGVTLSGGNLIVEQSTTAKTGSEFCYMNVAGVTYSYLLFR
ncbi:MAG: hypothetical protein LUG21_07520 [Clostridiales bacterium]|nr:hypothetical protein [Clostridiales bacterium]